MDKKEQIDDSQVRMRGPRGEEEYHFDCNFWLLGAERDRRVVVDGCLR